MRTTIIILAFVSIVFASCGDSQTATKEKELELKEQELKQKEESLLDDKKKEIELKEQELKQKEEELKSKSDNKQAKSEESIKKKYIAIIQDPDGYTNVRNGMSKNSEIIDRLFEGENYEVFPSSDNNWWLVYTQSNVKGYVHKSRIKIIN
jgi:hypothetical protein